MRRGWGLRLRAGWVSPAMAEVQRKGAGGGCPPHSMLLFLPIPSGLQMFPVASTGSSDTRSVPCLSHGIPCLSHGGGTLVLVGPELRSQERAGWHQQRGDAGRAGEPVPSAGDLLLMGSRGPMPLVVPNIPHPSGWAAPRLGRGQDQQHKGPRPLLGSPFSPPRPSDHKGTPKAGR